jgi:hypothetical protein
MRQPERSSDLYRVWSRFTALGRVNGQGRHRTTVVLDDCVVKLPFGLMRCVGCSNGGQRAELAWYEGDYPFPAARILVVDEIPVAYHKDTHCPRHEDTTTAVVLVSERVRPCVVPIKLAGDPTPEWGSYEAERVMDRLMRRFPWYREAVARGRLDCGQVGFTDADELVVFDYGDPCARR